MKKINDIGVGIVGKVIPNNTPVRVQDSTQVPYCYVGLLTMKFGEDTYIGTGTLIKEPGKETSSYVLTCAHNLYDPTDGKASSVTFTQAYNPPLTPYPAIAAEEFYYPDNYPGVAISRSVDIETLGDSILAVNIDYDYGLVKLSTPINLSSYPVLDVETTEELTDLPVQINGYGYFPDDAMSHATGFITNVTATALQYPITTEKGASGSAIMKNDNSLIVGIHTRSVSGANLNQGVRVTQALVDQVNKWMTSATTENDSDNNVQKQVSHDSLENKSE
jgi:V8-like Glu-specific endopeptidase